MLNWLKNIFKEKNPLVVERIDITRDELKVFQSKQCSTLTFPNPLEFSAVKVKFRTKKKRRKKR